MPHMATAPLDQGWAASHSTASYPSRVSSRGVLIERDARRRPGPTDVDPAVGVAASGEPAPRPMSVSSRQLSLPYGIISTIDREALVGLRRDRDAAATGSPTARRRREPGSGRPSSISTSWRGWLAGRPGRGIGHRRSLRAGRGGRTGRPARATIARWRDDAATPPHGPTRARAPTARGCAAHGGWPTRTPGSPSGTTR